MTFLQLKTDLLLKIKRAGICDDFQDALLTTNHNELIQIGKPFANWLITSNKVDDLVLDEFLNIDLENNGIYRTTQTIANPTQDIYILNGADLTINLSGNNKLNLFVISGRANVNLSNSAFCKVKAYNSAQVDLVLENEASLICNATQNALVNFNSKSQTACNIIINENAIVNAELENDSIVFVKAKDNSTLNYTTINNSEIIIRSSINSIITNGSTI